MSVTCLLMLMVCSLWLWVQTASEVSESELGRKGSDLAQKTVERVSEQAEELRKTDVGQVVQKVCYSMSQC